MNCTTTVTVRLDETLGRYVAERVGTHGVYVSAGEYLLDLIRRDLERSQQQAFERLEAQLALAYAAPDSAYRPLTAAEVIARNAA